MKKSSGKVVKFCVLAYILANVAADTPPAIGSQYQILQPQGPPGKPKQTIQQFQVAVVLPPGAKPVQGNQPPNPSPEYVWLQVPASLLTQQPDKVPRPPQDSFATDRPGVFMTLPTQRPFDAPVKPDAIATLPPGPPRPPTAPTPPPSTTAPWFTPFGVGVQQPVTTQSPSADLLLKRCLLPRGVFQSDKCNKYVNCWDGVAVEQFCPEELVFNPKGYCDYSYNVDCGGKPIEGIPPPPTPVGTPSIPVQTSSQPPTTAPPPTVIVSLPTINPALRKKCLKPRGQFRSESCNKYVNCWDDVVIEQECPEGLLFSNKGYCDYPANVDCLNVTAPTKSGSDFDKECPIEFGTFRDKANCMNYFTCIGGKVVAKYTCPEGFSFNDNLGVCDYAERVDCSKEPLIFLPKSNFLSNVPKDFMQKIDDCKPGSVFALNPQCTAACLCHDGISEVVQCPSGLAYDAQTDKCLSPHLARC